MKDFINGTVSKIEQEHHAHENYEFFRRKLLSPDKDGRLTIAQYELPPLKSAFPYHYHLKNEEFYYILSGEGIVRTPNKETCVKSGDFVYFPPNENGAHKITNTSKTESLIYLDFDTHNDLEVAIYPDSQKIGIWGKNINKVYHSNKNTNYYDGE